MKTRRGMDDADVGEDWLCQHTGNVTMRQRLFEPGHIVELDDARGHGGIDVGLRCRPHAA